MKKLVLREACYNGIDNVEKRELQTSLYHKDLVKEANEKIEKSRLRYATAYKNAGSYLGK